MPCTCCPRKCDVDRKSGGIGYCGAGALPRVARALPHYWEEPVIARHSHGSGAVFFSGCNLRCVFCQNKEISAFQKGEICDAKALAGIFAKLQERGVDNIDLVTPTPHTDTIAQALIIAKANGLSIPVIYNCGGYESVDALKRLNGLVDIYLPDFKYVTPSVSEAYSGVLDYGAFASAAIEEMYAQVGALTVTDDGTAKRGLIIRHLVLPGNIEETRRVLKFIRNTMPPQTYISLMRQYTPLSPELPAPLNRALTAREYERAVDFCIGLGFENVLIQQKGAVGEHYIPAFEGELPNGL